MSWALDQITLTASNKRTKTVLLSPTSQAVLLFVADVLSDRDFYIDDTDPYDNVTDVEWDTLDKIQAKAYREIMTGLPGEIVPVVTAEIPEGLLLCDGATYAREDYPALYDALDSQFIIDADSFRVPNIPTMSTLIQGDIGDTGGEIEHQLTEGEMPIHSHTYSKPEIPTLVLAPGEQPVAILDFLPDFTGTAGGNEAHNNMPPYFGVKMCVRTG